MRKPSAGIILYRKRGEETEILLVHPGGPFFRNKDAGVWSIPKGEADNGEADEALIAVAKREFSEETGMQPEGDFVFIGEAKRKDGKVVHAWAVEGDFDVAQLKSNTFSLEWPPRSGKKIEIPEVDYGAWVTPTVARQKLSPYLVPLIDAFMKAVL